MVSYLLPLPHHPIHFHHNQNEESATKEKGRDVSEGAALHQTSLGRKIIEIFNTTARPKYAPTNNQ